MNNALNRKPRIVIYGAGQYGLIAARIRNTPKNTGPGDCRYLQRNIEPGTSVATRVIARVGTKEGVAANARVAPGLIRDAESEHVIWKVAGKPRSHIRVEHRGSVYASAAIMINRVPDVLVLWRRSLRSLTQPGSGQKP